jgi:mono/diheme cytochrome c family protein
MHRYLPLLALLVILMALPALAAQVPLSLSLGADQRSLSAEELLKSPLAVDIEIPRDPNYGRAMRFRAVPLPALLAGAKIPADQVIEVVASDGFSAVLPLALMTTPPDDGGGPYLAIEPSDAPWPMLPGKTVSAGPYYIVWLKPEIAGVRSEQWVYEVVALRATDSPAKRWPALVVDATLAANDPARVGQDIFVTQCMVCHKLNRAGNSDIGPDLNLPMNPTEYFQPKALARYIRNPASVRKWNAMAMPAFNTDMLSDREIVEIIAYLTHMAGRKAQP